MRKFKVRVTEMIVGFIEVEASDAIEAEWVADATYQKNVTSMTQDMGSCGVVCKTIKEMTAVKEKEEGGLYDCD